MESSNSILEEFLCSICWNIYYNPIKLDCDHNYCHHCIFFWLENEEEGIKCPKCRKFYPITTQLKFDTFLINKLKKIHPKLYSEREIFVTNFLKEEEKLEKVKILYGNYLVKQDEKNNKLPKNQEWRFFVKLADNKIDVNKYIEKIEVNLDPAYGAKFIPLLKPPFEIKMNFGTEMDITFRIHWQKYIKRDPVNFIYFISFNGGLGKTNSYLLTFQK